MLLSFIQSFENLLNSCFVGLLGSGEASPVNAVCTEVKGTFGGERLAMRTVDAGIYPFVKTVYLSSQTFGVEIQGGFISRNKVVERGIEDANDL